MKIINKEYERLFIELEKSKGSKKTNEDLKNEVNEFTKIFETLFKYDSTIEIEICGTWIWIDGETKKIKEILRRLGFKWSSKKKKWHYTKDVRKKHYKKDMSMEQIRKKYGSTVYTEDKKKSYSNRYLNTKMD